MKITKPNIPQCTICNKTNELVNFKSGFVCKECIGFVKSNK